MKNAIKTVAWAIEGVQVMAAKGHIDRAQTRAALADLGGEQADDGLWDFHGQPWRVEVLEVGMDGAVLWRSMTPKAE